MLGAVLAARAARQGFAAINRQDVDAVAALFADDAVFEFPGHSAMAGRFEGKAAIRQWFTTLFGRMKMRFTLKHISVERIFTLGASNTVHVEWELDETDAAGETFHLTGVTALHARRGKLVLVHDYIPDQDVLERAWPVHTLA